MKTKLNVLFVGLVISLSAFTYPVTENVYICKGPSSKKYHLKKNCRGLSNCSTDIYSVTKEKAKSLNRTLCGWED
ncbi:hypothetical protein SAMN04488096_102105 [Mesonia phycicola]|uniref:Uncharacterized protein n=1 Tax=Mesonia phycicola TaxID=579105 RepID=A0A1M6BKW2_9FLAO|nr:hypothetical protein [Mesonia phycicola]SHI49351.1 hypothetical protein SAMN04488096_102105 [Mesonia phycicola]